MKEFDIPQIDLVIVDLYPFEKQFPGASEVISLKNRYWWNFNLCCKKLQGYRYSFS
jgi:hypothetical protein